MRASPHPFTLRQLQYAVVVGEELSFRKAAQRCHVSQPSLSAQVAQLEEVLGVRLFERDRKKVLLTKGGRTLLTRARRLLLEADDLFEAGRLASDPLAGTLRLGVIPTISPYLLPPITPLLRKAFARLTLAWREDKTELLIQSLQAGTLDAALIALEADVGDVEVERIGHDPFVLAAQPSHPLMKKQSPVAASELRGAEILLLDEGHCFRSQALEVCSSARAHETAFRATSLNTLVQMVGGNGGVTVLPRLAVATEAKRAGLRTRPLQGQGAHRTLALVWRRRSALRPALKVVAEVIREGFEHLK